MNTDQIKKASTKELYQELASRGVIIPPTLTLNPNTDNLLEMLINHKKWIESDNYHEDREGDERVYLYECLMETYWGKNFLSWKNHITDS